jgi:hypothetical protein
VYAVVEAPNNASATTKTQAVVGGVEVDATGKITGVWMSERGAGYVDPVKIEVKSLLGGTGATLEVKVNTFSTTGSLNTPLVTAGGSGYPAVDDANVARREAPGSLTPQFVKSGDIKVINVDYGTGTSRAKDIQ